MPPIPLAGLTTAGVAVLGVVAVAGSRSPTVALGATAAVAGTAALIARPWLGALVLGGVVPVTAGLARGVPVPGLRLSEALTVWVAGVVLLTADGRRDTRWRRIDTAALAFAVLHLGFGLAAAIRNADTLSGADLGVLAGPLQFYVYFRALTLVLTTPRVRAAALAALLAGSFVVSASAIAQRMSLTADRVLRDLTGYAPDADTLSTLARATGPFPHFQVLSAYLAGIVVVAVATLLFGERRGGVRPLALAALGLACVALMLTVTIASTCGALLGAVMLIASHPRRWALLGGLAVVVCALGLAFAPLIAARAKEQSTIVTGAAASARNPLVPQTLAYRYEIWTQQSLPVIRQNLLLGSGAAIPDSVAWRSTESMYVTLLFRGGVPLLVAWLAVAAALLAIGRSRRASPDVSQRVAGRALFALVAVLLPMQIVQPYMTYGGVSHVVWLLAALAAVNPVLHHAFERPRAGRAAPALATRSLAPIVDH